jgi:acyl carrier protein
VLKAEFLEELRDLLQRDDPIEPDMLLQNIGEWDSLAVMSCMAYYDKHFNIKTKMAQYRDLRTVSDLIDLAGGAVT